VKDHPPWNPIASPRSSFAVEAELRRVIVGQDELVRDVLTCLFAGGHALLEGVPGLGKTVLLRTLAETLSIDSTRLQCTPDLLPADVVGTTVLGESGEGGGGGTPASSRDRCSPSCCSPTSSTAPRRRPSRRCSRRWPSGASPSPG
jgi:hypothetical protein